MLDPVKVETLQAVVRHRSFSAAAHALHLTQPAVSRQIAALERGLGAALVVRTRGRIDPTPAGEVLLRHAGPALDQLRLAETQVRGLAGGENGEVRLGSFFTALVHLSAEATAVLTDSRPGLRIVDDLVDRATAYAKVSRGELDLALVFAPPFAGLDPPAGVRVTALFDDPVRVVLPAGHRLAGRPAVDPADLAGDVWIRAHEGSAAEVLDRVLAAHDVRPELLHAGHGDEPVEIQALVAAGRGVTLTYDLTVIVGRVEVLPLAGAVVSRTVAVVVPDGPLPAATRSTLDALLEVGRRRAGPDHDGSQRPASTRAGSGVAAG